MKRMYSKEEFVQFLKDNSEAIIEALNNKDISIAGLTSKGIANTGGLANIGDVVVSGDITAQGEGKGKVSANQVVIPDAESIVDQNGDPISFGDGTKLYAHYLYLTINSNNYYFRITSNRKEAYTTVDQLRVDFSNGRIVNILRNYTANKMSNCLVMLDIQTSPSVVITWTFVSFSGTSSSNIDGISGVITALGTDTISEL